MQRQSLVAGLAIVIGSLALTIRVGSSVAQAPPTAPEVNPKILAFVKTVEIHASESELQKKLKERHNVAVQLLSERVNEYRKGVRDVNSVFEAARYVVDAKLDIADTRQAKTAVLEQVVDIAKLMESQLGEQLKKGFGAKSDFERARLARLNAEVELLRAQGK